MAALGDDGGIVDGITRVMVSGPGVFTTFAYYFGLTAILGGVAASRAMGLPYNHPTSVQAGLLLGLFAGGVGVMLNRSVALELPLPKKARERTAFQQQLTQALEQLFFETLEVEREDRVEVYQRPTGAWLSGRLYVQQEAEQVRIVGRASIMKKLKAKLK